MMKQKQLQEMDSVSRPTRQLSLDGLRVLATIAVITLHATSKQWYRAPIDSTDWQVLNIYDSLVRFCVPVFFMISGVFFLSPEKEFSIKKLYCKNISKILLTFFAWSSFYALVRMYRGNYDFTVPFFLRQVAVGHYHLWFLFTLFGLYLMVPILRVIAKEKESLQYFLLLSFVFVQGGNFLQLSAEIGSWLILWQEKANIYLVLGYSGYFLLGYYLSAYSVKEWIQKLLHCCAVFSLVFTVIGTHWLSQRNGVATSTLYHYLLPNTACVSASLFLIFLKWNISDKWRQLISLFSTLSFGIYLIHDFFLVLFLEDFNWLELGIPAIISVPLFSGAVCFVSFCATWILAQVPVLRKIIGYSKTGN